MRSRDLVFVAAVSRTSQILADDPSAAGAAWFAFLFVAITWSWTNFVMYTERFDTDDVPHRLTKAAAMVAVAGVAYTAPDARGESAVEFALAYCAMRAVLIGLYVRAWRHVVEVRSAIAVYLVGFSLGAACWAASVLVEGDGRTALWVAGAGHRGRHPRRRLVSASARPLRQPSTSRSGRASSRSSSSARRSSAPSTGLDGVQWNGRVWLTALAVAVVIVCLWWLTFDFVENVPPGLRALARPERAHPDLHGHRRARRRVRARVPPRRGGCAVPAGPLDPLRGHRALPRRHHLHRDGRRPSSARGLATRRPPRSSTRHIWRATSLHFGYARSS